MPYTAATGEEGRLAEADRVRRLEPPEGNVTAVLDTDTYNEIDDQFALAYAYCSPAIDLQAVYAAPFHNDNSEGPGDGMERSYAEIRRVLDLLDEPDPDGLAYRGTAGYLEDADGPVQNPAVDDLIRRARDRDGPDPLYVLAIGAPTNVAAAIERAPEIIEGIVVVWLGGHPYTWHTASEFNLGQDLRATRLLFDSGVPLVQIPCKNVAEHVRTTVPELEAHLGGEGDLAEYLLEITAEHGERVGREVFSKEIWDVAPVAYLLDHEWVPTNLLHSPRISEDCRYARDTSRHLVRVGVDARRDPIFEDFFGSVRNR